MARYVKTPLFTGSINGICIYRMGQRYFVRTKSSLTGNRVKTDTAFQRTRQKASLLATASAIASEIYRALPAGWRQHWMYRAFTGEAMHMLNENKPAQQVRQWLWQTYVQLWEERKLQVAGENETHFTSMKPKAAGSGHHYTLINGKQYKQGILTVKRIHPHTTILATKQWVCPAKVLPP